MEPAGSRVPVSLLMAMVISFSPSALSPLSCKQLSAAPPSAPRSEETAHSRVRVLFVSSVFSFFYSCRFSFLRLAHPSISEMSFIAFCSSAAVFFRVEEAFYRPLPEYIAVRCFLPAAVHGVGTVFCKRTAPLRSAVSARQLRTFLPERDSFSPSCPQRIRGRHGQEKLLRIGMPGIGADRSGSSCLHPVLPGRGRPFCR